VNIEQVFYPNQTCASTCTYTIIDFVHMHGLLLGSFARFPSGLIIVAHSGVFFLSALHFVLMEHSKLPIISYCIFVLCNYLETMDYSFRSKLECYSHFEKPCH